MNRLKRILPGDIQANRHATSEDFCRLFSNKLDSLYLLSLLLTGDQRKAEQCFAGGLEVSLHTKQVFKELAHCWAKLTIVRGAIAELQPRPEWGDSSLPLTITAESCDLSNEIGFELHHVLALPSFLRFVFVLSVLEQYSDHDCSRLLGCSVDELQHARMRVLELMADTDLSASTGGTGLADAPVIGK